jgi:hypothetical protein
MAKKQLAIRGTEPKTIKELDDAAEAYVDARDKRIERTEKETEAKEALIEVMKKHELSVYRDDTASPPLVVTLVPGKDNVKVSRAEDEEEAPEVDP